MEYLHAARPLIRQCATACQQWSAAYDGENPSPDSLFAKEKEEPLLNSSVAEGQSETVLQSAGQADTALQNTDKLEGLVQKSVLQTENTEHSTTKVDGAKATSQNEDNSNSKQHEAAAMAEKSPPVIKPTLLQKDCYAESTPSEADSALSGSSTNTDNLHTTTSDITNPASRTDSPLNDNFDNVDFNSFLLTLKRVKTPVEFCDSLEDCLSEIDSVVDKVKLIQVTPKRTLSSSSATKSICDSVPNNLPSILPSNLAEDISKSENVSKSRTSTDASDTEEKLTSFDSALNLNQVGTIYTGKMFLENI